MHRKIAGLFFATSVAFVALAGSASAQNSPGIAALDTALRGAVERKDVPGIVALVTDRKGVIYQGAFGVADVSTGRPLAADSMFRIASMTKPITSFALMQLVEQGKARPRRPGVEISCRSWPTSRWSSRSTRQPARTSCAPPRGPPLSGTS